MRDDGGLPVWAHTIVFLGTFSLTVYAVARFGVDGFPLVMTFCGILGGYIGVNELVRAGRGIGR